MSGVVWFAARYSRILRQWELTVEIRKKKTLQRRTGLCKGFVSATNLKFIFSAIVSF
jgi:hypothetical protein